MRVIRSGTGIAFLALAAMAGPLQAEERPWCIEFDPFTKTCDFSSQNQCAEVAKSVGATCVRNGRYHSAAEKSSLRAVPARQR